MAEDVKVPEGWGKVSLLEKLAFIKGKAPKRSYDFKEKNTIRYLTPEYLRGRNLETFYCDLNEAEIVNGDVVILWDGSNAGEIFFAKDGAIASTMAKIEIDKKLHKRFFYYYLKLYEPILKYQIKGSGIPHVEKDIFGLLPNIFPPLSEQCKISEILETVDNAIGKTEKIIEKYKRIKQGLMQELLTKGIDENGQIRSEETHKFKDSPLGRIPEEWEVVELGEVGKIASGSTPDTSKPEFWDGNIIWITPDDLSKLNTRYIHTSKRRITEKGLKNCSAKLIPPNSIVISSRAPIGYLAISKVRFATNQGCKSIILNSSNDPDFFYYCLHIYIKKMITLGSGTTFSEISKSDLEKMRISIPKSKSEQKRIASILSQIDEAIEKEQKYKEKLEKIKRGLMEDLLAGKVRVNKLLKKQV